MADKYVERILDEVCFNFERHFNDVEEKIEFVEELISELEDLMDKLEEDRCGINDGDARKRDYVDWIIKNAVDENIPKGKLPR